VPVDAGALPAAGIQAAVLQLSRVARVVERAEEIPGRDGEEQAPDVPRRRPEPRQRRVRRRRARRSEHDGGGEGEEDRTPGHDSDGTPER